MNELNQATKIISQAGNILILGPESPNFDELSSAFSLYYTLNKTGKLVNHYLDKLHNNYPQVFEPEVLPKTFLITIKSDDISQLYYEKQKKLLKIFLTTKNKLVNESDIKISPPEMQSLEKCDLIITVGLKNLELLGDLYDKNFKLFYQTPILNIDNNASNNRFGNFNLITEDQPIAVLLNTLIKSANYQLDEKAKLWMLFGIINYLENKEPNHATLKAISELISIEVNFKKLIEYLYKEKENQPGDNAGVPMFQIDLLVQALNVIEFSKDTTIISFTKEHFENSNSKPKDIKFVLEKLTKETFHFPELLVLWQDSPFIKGVFYSKKKQSINKFSEKFIGQKKGQGIIFETKFKDLEVAKKL